MELMLYSFLNWNLPYGATRSSTFQIFGNSAPSPMSVSTPSDIEVTTPPTNDALSPNNALSPLSRAIHTKQAVDRAHMFIEGRYGALIKSMREEERA